MSAEVLAACIKLALKSEKPRLVLHHFGEPLLHPLLNERLAQIAEAGIPVQFSTNALLLNSCWDTLVSARLPVSVMIAVHQWAQLGEAIYLSELQHWRRRAEGTNVDILQAYNLKNGQYTFHRWAKGKAEEWNVAECPFIKYNLAVVLWNGDLVTCCVDHEGETKTGNILEAGSETRVSRPWRACVSCDVGRLMRGEVW